MQRLLDIISTQTEYRTFWAAARQAGLVGLLASPWPSTLLVPTDDAFAALPRGAVAELLEPPRRRQLVLLVRRHVLAGWIDTRLALRLTEVRSLSNELLPVTTGRGKLRIAGAGVVPPTIPCENGVIHTLDGVLTGPPSPDTRRNDPDPQADAPFRFHKDPL
jgi:uncharacterized surface protein with fasciclin (FAS1) repeats